MALEHNMSETVIAALLVADSVQSAVCRTLTCCAAQVALGRKMSEEDVRKVAKGRAWTGRDALEHGLVDALGGLQLAISLAKMEAGLPLEVRCCLIMTSCTDVHCSDEEAAQAQNICSAANDLQGGM